MMRAEKIASDISEAHEIVAGPASPMPPLASLVRRLERKGHEAGGLLDASIAAIDRSLVALDAATAALEAAHRRGRLRSAATGADRGTAVRAPRRLTQVRRAGGRPAGADASAWRRTCRARARRGATSRRSTPKLAAGEGAL